MGESIGYSLLERFRPSTGFPGSEVGCDRADVYL